MYVKKKQHFYSPFAQIKQESCPERQEGMAGPVGFEPTILGFLREQRTIVQAGSEGPRLGPGSTTGPNLVAPNSALLLSWANRPLKLGLRVETTIRELSQKDDINGWTSKLKASSAQASIYNVSKPSVIHELKGKSRIFLP
jgi:hypothetical protein